MSRLATSFVLGYHGCDQAVAQKAISGQIDILKSDKDFDWLGPGAYFWESDPERALEWANEKASRGAYKHPTVIGAVIDLRNCLDLLSRDDVNLLASAHSSFLKFRKKAQLPVPKNRSVPGQKNSDKVLRYLDCAVFRHLHSIIEAQASQESAIEPFDTIRGLFTEGGALYKGSGLRKKTHVQIAVRNIACIRGVFWPK